MKTDKLRLWVDGQCLQTLSRMRGIGRYVQEFLIELAENRQDLDLHVSLNAAMSQQAVAARDYLQKWVAPDNIHVWHGLAEGPEHTFGYTKRRELSEIALRYHVAELAPDVALSASPFEEGGAVPLLPGGMLEIPTASIFYDAIPLRFPKHYLTNPRVEDFYQRRLAAHKEFNLNLCISDFSRKELLALVGQENSINMSAGVSKEFLKLLSSTGNIIREPNTLLYVGGFDWRKNVPRVIEAISYLEGTLRDELKFILVGDIDKLIAEQLRRQWKTLRLPIDNLQLVGHVSDYMLTRYYQSVAAVIQPSLMEGFGLTALEAVLCDAPVIASRAGALPEIIIDEARLFDPTDAMDIAHHIQYVLEGTSGSTSLTSDLKEHVHSFTWQRTADIAVRALKEIANLENRRDGTLLSAQREQKVVDALASLKLPIELKAGCLSRAQKPVGHPPRLIVDATATIISNAGTGIQRVVTKIVQHINDNTNHAAKSVIAFSASEDAWYAVPNGDLKTTPADIQRNNEKLYLDGNDHVLMLDSSWAFYPYHARTLTYGRLRGCQVTTCLYDLVPLKASGFTGSGMPDIFARWFRAALTYSTGFICISKAVADELIALLESINFPKSLNIGYWPLGADFSFGATPKQRRTNLESVQQTSFLMVGTIEPRKGHRVALDALDLLWQRGIDVRLTIVGKLGWNARKFVERLQVHPEWNVRLFWDSQATDDQLQGYYADADCLIASSFAEGFGLPIVEAGHFGKPVIASDIPVFREVARKSHFSRFFETGNATSLASEMEKFISIKEHIEEEKNVVSSWENWAESASTLKDVVLNGGWYHIYQPKEPRYFTNIAEAVEIKMQEPVPVEDRLVGLSIEDGPLSGDIPDHVHYVIKVTNLSNINWSSIGTDEGNYGLRLAVRLFDQDNRFIIEGPRTQIPFILASRDTIYVSVEIPENWKDYDEATVQIEFVQDGGAWWGNPITLSTNHIK